MQNKSIIANACIVLTVLFFVLISQIMPDLTDSIKYYLLAASLLLIGIPHGAIDHIVTSRMYDLKNNFSDQLQFYIPYLLLMSLMALLWFYSGILGFLIFALITVYHFGQADMESLEFPGPISGLMILSRGLMILALIIFFDTSYTFPVIEAATGYTPENLMFLQAYSLYFGLFLAFQHPLLMIIVLFIYRDQSTGSYWYALIDSLVVFILFVFTDPIIGFSIYFALWHSLGHVIEMKAFFQSIGEHMDTLRFYKLALPFTLISILGLILIYIINKVLGVEEQMVALLFILISILTLPHVLVVHKMYDLRNKELLTDEIPDHNPENYW